MSCENHCPPGVVMEPCNLIMGSTLGQIEIVELYQSAVCVCVCLRDVFMCDVFLCTNRFMVRDFQYNEEEMKADKEEMTRLSTDKKKQFVCIHTTTAVKHCNGVHSK